MSWSVKASGSKDNVKAVIDFDKQIPQPVKAMIMAQVDGMSLESRWSGDPLEYQVLVETWGHVEQDHMDIGAIKVQRVACGMLPAPAPSA